VIPLPRMGEYTLGIERINIELSLRNKLSLLDAFDTFFHGGIAAVGQFIGKADDPSELPSPEQLTEKVETAQALLAQVRARWQFLHHSLDTPLGVVSDELSALGYQQHLDGTFKPAEGDTVFNLLQTWSIRAGWKKEIREELAKVFNGGALSPIVDELKRGWPCTCTPATAMCTPTSPSTPTTTRCCRRPTKPWPAS